MPAKWHEPNTVWQRYLVAILITLGCVLVRLLLSPLVGNEVPLILFYLGVITTSWLGGLGPGLLSAGLGLVLAAYLFISPGAAWAIDLHRESVVMYIILAPVTALIVSGMRRTLHRAKCAEASLLESQRRMHAYADELEERVQERTKDLEASLGAIEELLYTIAHDLRAPNRAMQAYSEILATEYSNKLDDTARDYLQRIGKSALHSDALITDLLEYGKLSHQQLSLRSIDSRELVAQVAERFKPEVEQRGGSIQLAGQFPPVVADAPLLERVMEELLDNAIKHVSGQTAPRILIEAQTAADTAVLRVCDNGPGIPPNLSSRVFAPFVRFTNSGQEGTGIGLAIVRKALTRMNGSVRLGAPRGRGACFELVLPLARQRTEAPSGIDPT